jgi:hypothetical protein
MPSAEWLAEIEAIVGRGTNLRLVILDDRYDLEEIALAGLLESIGDYTVLLYVGEVAPEQAGRLFALVPQMIHEAMQGYDFVKLMAAPAPFWQPQIALSRLAACFIRLLTGYRIDPHLFRSMCVSRAGTNAITQRRGDTRYFRFLDFRSVYAMAILAAPGLGRHVSRRDHVRRMLVLMELFGHAAPRLLRLLALIAFPVSCASFGYGFYAFAFWLFSEELPRGWTSLSMVLAVLFGVTLVALAMIAVGVARILETIRAGRPYGIAREINRADLFGRSTALNVQGRERRTPCDAG